MGIQKIILNEIKRDFHSGSDQESFTKTEEEMDRFWSWFEENATKLEVSNEPICSVVSKTNRSGRCFGNSQIIALRENKKYYEGFVKVNGRFIFHGFNVENQQVQDFTVLSNKNEFYDLNGSLPSEYYGVEIGKEIIINNNKEKLENNEMNIIYLVDKIWK